MNDAGFIGPALRDRESDSFVASRCEAGSALLMPRLQFGSQTAVASARERPLSCGIPGLRAAGYNKSGIPGLRAAGYNKSGIPGHNGWLQQERHSRPQSGRLQQRLPQHLGRRSEHALDKARLTGNRDLRSGRLRVPCIAVGTENLL